MTELRAAARPAKANLGRARLVVILLSGLAFAGSLAGVSMAHPATQGASPAKVAPASRAPAQLESTAQLQARLETVPRLQRPARPQMPPLRPLVRTRGS
jgi:hypothetical protein